MSQPEHFARSTQMAKAVFRKLLVAAAMAVTALAAMAADTTLLIQVESSGGYKVWHADGLTKLTEGEIQALEVNATPEGGKEVQTSHGPARSFKTGHTVLISVPGARFEKTLLLSHDACSAPKIWHGDGPTRLTEGQITDIVLSAHPDGGKGIVIGNRVIKGYTTEYGVMAVIFSRNAQKR